MKVLIIGGMGVIGGAITRAAVSKQIDVFILSRRQLYGEWKEQRVTGIQGNWKDDYFAKEIVSQFFDVIVDTQVFDEKQLKRSLEIVEGYCIQYIYISTDSVYVHPNTDLREDQEINLDEIKWDYGIKKRKGELYLLANGAKYSFFWTGIRPTITFGNTRIPVGYSSRRNTYTLAERIIDRKPIVRFDEPETRHAICHVSIFGNAVVDLFLQTKAANQFYHISDDNSYTYDEIFEAIESVLGVDGIYVHVPVKAVKKYSRVVYEEMIYDKNPVFTLNNEKIKELSQDTCYHVNIVDAMKETLNHLKMRRSDSVGDKEYDMVTDSILLETKDRVLDDALREKIEKYTTGLSESYLSELKKFKRKKFFEAAVYPLRKSARNVKNHIRKIIDNINENDFKHIKKEINNDYTRNFFKRF